MFLFLILIEEDRGSIEDAPVIRDLVHKCIKYGNKYSTITN